MDTVYWISLLVGGFFVLLSIFGGGETDTDVEADFDADVDFDAEAEVDFDFDTEADYDGEIDTGSGVSGAPDFVDLFSIRALFLFAAFFGLTGVLLSLVGTGEPLTAVLAALTGALIGLGGNYVIKRVGYAHVSSDIGARDLKGRTATVILPFDRADRGKISVVSKGQRLQLPARSFEGADGAFQPGDEVVVVRVEGRVAEVVKPK
ncbi:MAG: hypothetical protein R3247_10820 [Rhodothermales bacterium]|nr:hypothetical protein [Rhodothermales bacterium]